MLILTSLATIKTMLRLLTWLRCCFCRTRRCAPPRTRSAPRWPMRCVSRLPPLGQRAYRAWPRIRPRLTRRLFLCRLRWEEDTRLSGLLVAESEPGHGGRPGLADRDQGSARRVFGAFVQGRDYCRLA